MYYIDVPENTNIDCVLDGKKELAAQATNVLTVSATMATALTFAVTTVAGVKVFTISGTGLTGFEVGDTIIIRGSDDDGVNNDGVYTVVTVPSGTSITVKESVIAAVSDLTTKAGGLYVDEYATFVLHPTRRTGQIVTFIETDANIATFEVSFRPGGFWASTIEPGLPIMQADGVLSKMYLIQVETAPYLQTEEEDLDLDGVNVAEKKGAMLMRVFPPGGVTLPAGCIEVAFVQLA